MMLRPNTSCVVTPLRGHDVYGQELVGEAYEAKCAIVKIQSRTDKTTVRADSSASRGYAEENTVDARLLFPPSTPLERGDKLDLLNISLRVIEIMPRVGLHGRLDHLQVDAVIWA